MGWPAMNHIWPAPTPGMKTLSATADQYLSRYKYCILSRDGHGAVRMGEAFRSRAVKGIRRLYSGEPAP